MKANELMIGDWVEHIVVGEQSRNHPMKVDLRDLYRIQSAISNSDDSLIVRPIPITPEVLEKNGWKYEFDKEEYRVKYMLGEQGKNCWMMWSCKYHIIDIQRQDEKLDFYNLCITKVCIPCEYVHQLQQALRLSELRDMADNIKV